MYCEFEGGYVEDVECRTCEEDCEHAPAGANRLAKEMENLRSSELAKKIRQTLAKSLNLKDDQLDKLTKNLFDGAFKSAETQFKTCLESMAKQMAVKYFEAKTKKMCDELFDKAINEQILILSEDGKAQETRVQQIALDRMKKFFDDQHSYNNRNKASETLDKAIEKAVSAKVATTLNELKEESIEKFNKEIMKKMMAGMVGAIQGDKRLLAVLGH